MGVLEVLNAVNIDESEKVDVHKIFNIITTEKYILEQLTIERSFDKTKVNIFLNLKKIFQTLLLDLKIKK